MLSIFGPYVSEIEHQLINHPNLVKGISLAKRDSKLGTGSGTNGSLPSFSHYLETDYSRYDLSISAAYIRHIERIFLALPFVHDDAYLELLPWLEVTKGVSDLGLTYTVLGTRCSGDAHTSIANGLINHFNTWVALFELPVDSWCSYHEGDDGIIGVSSEWVDQAVYNMHIMPVLGYQLKLDVYRSLGDASFCGRFLLDRFGTVSSYCDLRRTLSKLHTICSDGDAESLLLAKMISYYHTDRSTPIVGALATVIIQLLLPRVSKRRLTRAMSHLRRDFWFRNKFDGELMFRDSYPFVAPDALLRAFVSTRCGLNPITQQRLEAYYLSWLNLGYIPSVIDKILDEWVVKFNQHIHGNPEHWVA